jgi:predicted nucleotide-binding protein
MKKSAENGKGVKKKHTWRMFIASSKEGIEYAKAIQLVINRKFKRKVCEVWNQGAFKNGKAYLETLEHLASDFDCGLAVFTADRPAGNQWAPSYNVVLEYGLFLGAFGRNRTFVLREDAKGKVLEIPTDLAGITLGEFSTSEEMGESERSEAVKRASMEV